MRTRNHDWFDSAKMAVVYGVQVYHDGKWRHAAIDGKPVLCATQAERDAQRKRLKQIAKAAVVALLLSGCSRTLPPYTVQLDHGQADLVETCWGNGWDVRIQSDGTGGMQIACKAAY